MEVGRADLQPRCKYEPPRGRIGGPSVMYNGDKKAYTGAKGGYAGRLRTKGQPAADWQLGIPLFPLLPEETATLRETDRRRPT